MKFVFVDESGDARSDPILVHFGLMVDAYKLKTTMRAARPVLTRVDTAYPGDLREIKASRLVNGVGAWRNVAPEDRKALFLELCGLAAEASAGCFASLLDRGRIGKVPAPVWAATPWMTGAIALAMSIQRVNQRQRRNKGLTVLIFDDNKMELPAFSEFLMQSAPEIDEFYERKRGGDPFDHIIETAFAIKSEHSELVQVSDACAFALRRRAEIELCGSPEAWAGEADLFAEAVSAFKDRLQFAPGMWTGTADLPAVEYLREVSPANLKDWLS